MKVREAIALLGKEDPDKEIEMFFSVNPSPYVGALTRIYKNAASSISMEFEEKKETKP